MTGSRYNHDRQDGGPTIRELDRTGASKAFPTHAELCKILGRAQLKGWIRFPGEADTPAAMMERGVKLQHAIDTNDQNGIAQYGVQPMKRGPKPKSEQ